MSVRIEHAPRTVLETLQLERLQQLVARLKRVPRGAELPEIETLDDLEQIPFTVKDDLRASYPLGMLAVPRDRAAPHPRLLRHRRHADRRRLHRARPRRLVEGDVALHGDGRRDGRDGRPQRLRLRPVHRRARLPPGRGAPRRARDPGRPAASPRARRPCCATSQGQVLCCTPSYALHIAQGLREAGIAPEDLKLEIGMFGAEPWTEGMRERLEPELGLTALNIYGLSEIVGPGVSAECPEARDGLHVQEDHFLVEVIDPDTGERGPGRHRRRARLHDADQGGAAAPALPHRRHRQPHPRALRVRPDLRAHERRPRPPRRHADRPRRQPLPLADRARPARPAGRRSALPAVVERPDALDEVTVRCEPVDDGADAHALAARVEHARSASGSASA